MDTLTLFYPDGHETHFEAGHPERPERIEAIRTVFEDEGIWESASLVTPLDLPEEVLNAIHRPEYLSRINAASVLGERLDADTYITPASYQLALNAAGGAAAVAEQVWTREARRGFALCRPPGHHATPNRAMGFCLINNIAVAAEHLLQNHHAERLAILDIDLHHGNGTQDIFWSRGEVFFISIHQYPLYPYSGQLDETGAGPGENTTLNLPFPPQAGDLAREAALLELILPVLAKYNPDMLLISAGFDAHWRDPLGHQLASTSGYGTFFSTLAEWCDQHCQGRIAVFLEGGYDLQAGATGAAAAANALLERSWNDPLGKSPDEEDTRWQAVLEQAKTIWNL